MEKGIVMNEYEEALKKLTEVVRELNKELAELKKDYKSHGHVELVSKDKNYNPVEVKNI